MIGNPSVSRHSSTVTVVVSCSIAMLFAVIVGASVAENSETGLGGGNSEIAMFSDVHAFQLDAPFSGEPYFKPGEIVLSWTTEEPFETYRIDLGLDPEFAKPLAFLNGTGPGPCRIPENLTGSSGKFYYRINVAKQDRGSVAQSPVK